MLVAIIAEKNLDYMFDVMSCLPPTVQTVELRLDYLEFICYKSLVKLINKFNYSFIFTLRSKEQGGFFEGSEEQRLSHIEKLLELQPCYIDLEYNVNPNFINKVLTDWPQVTIIRSFHCFAVDNCIDSVFSIMKVDYPCIYKIIMTAENIDAWLKSLQFLRQHQSQLNLVVHCLGRYGMPSRIIGAIFGNYFSYAASNYNTLHGNNHVLKDLPSIDTMINIYNWPLLNGNTKLYALLGDPVEHSIGDVYHNNYFKKHIINAVYIKIAMRFKELECFLQQAGHLGFIGFSITMPLKKKVLAYVNHRGFPDTLASCNTLFWQHNSYYGYNTDGCGAIAAIGSQNIQKKNILVIGAGGSADAIVDSLSREKEVAVTVVNRTHATAVQLASKYNFTGFDFAKFICAEIDPINIIINTLPNTCILPDAFMKALQYCIAKSIILLNADYSTDNPILHKELLPASVETISGKEMFLQQAKLQQQIWQDN